MPGAFDLHHPPDAALVDECVRCGFCLPTCPTYLLWGEEMDSPRGGIQLMEIGLEGDPLTPAMVGHFDACLGCMACVTACPSGVKYDRLIEATRQQVERRHRRSFGDRLFRGLIFVLFPYPRRLRALLRPLRWYRRLGVGAFLRRAGVFRRLPGRLRAMESLLPDLPTRAPDLPAFTPAAGDARLTVGLLSGCVQRVVFPGVNEATVRVLAAEGCEVVCPPGQGCCGALSMHAGREAEAQAFARALIDRFEDARVDAVAVNAAGCGSTMKGYGHLLRDDAAYRERAEAFAASVRDVSEVLAGLEPVAPRHPVPARVAYHDACHLAHAQGIRAEPRAVLATIPGLTVLEIREAEICCGSAGIYNLVEPEPAAELGERKARNVLATGAGAVVTANPGCILQIRASLERLGSPLPILHPVEMLDASIRGEPLPGLTGPPGPQGRKR